MIWFTADTHFGHANIIRHSSRPFANVNEMDERLVANINLLVSGNDTLYHLGDWSWKEPLRYRDQIDCQNIALILGNHDKEIRRRKDHFGGPGSRFCFNTITDFLEIKLGCGQEITLCHYALRVWNKCHHGTWHLYGHSHGSLPNDPASRSFDIGVDCQGYRPLNLDQVADLMSKKEWKPIDHHGNRPYERAQPAR